MDNQLSIFDVIYEKYKISKPIRLIELFGGYGSQSFSLKYLGVEFEHWKLCEWAVKSIQAYKDAHFPNESYKFDETITKEVLVDWLFKKGISFDYNKPANYDEIKRKSFEELKNIVSNIKITNNLVNIQNVKGIDLEINNTDKYEYIMTYSFPCQDLSLAGKGKGMDRDSGTRSGMLWEVERILDELKNNNLELPQILLMENVPQVIGTENVDNFNEWQLKLEQLGYKNYHNNLIATGYGIPQTRNRTFMISILGNYSYTFPNTIPLKLKLKDMLEDEVGEKYYLSDKMRKYIFSEDDKYKVNKNSLKLDREIACSKTTREGNTRADTSDYITFSKVVTNVNPSGNGMNGDVFDSNYLCPTLTTNKGEGIKIKETKCLNSKVNGKQPSLQDRIYDIDGMSTTLTTSFLPNILVPESTKKGYAEAYEGDSINLEQPNSKIRRGRVGKQVSQTLLTSPQIATLVNKIDIPQKVRKRKYEVNIEKLKETLKRHKNITNKEIANKLNKPITEVEHWFRKDNSFSIPDESIWFELKNIIGIKTNEFDEGITTFIEQNGVFEKGNRIYLDNGAAPTLTCASANEKIMTNLKIRKLKPKECFRLMGVKDEDFERIAKNQSDSSLYHLAGDSIVINVLMAIFGELLGIDWKSKIDNLLNEVKNNN